MFKRDRSSSELDSKVQSMLADAKKTLENMVSQNETISKLDEHTISSSTDQNKPQYQSQVATVSLDKDVILSQSTRLQLDEAIAKTRFHKTIYEDWNFGSVDKQGRSLILNFFGEPGTGKTLCAEAFAGSLNKPIVKLGIAEIESRFMGESAKNLQTAFANAKAQDAVLFFDEADTLLGKRLSSVTQGIDNEVNALRSTLLIELEKFDGIVIFATNFAKNYDSAFRSRISHHIRFELPDYDARLKIWDKMLVEQIPLADDRQLLLEEISKNSDGFSGREIRTAMRLVLPKVLLEAEKNHTDPKVSIRSLLTVIDEINTAKKSAGNKRREENIDVSSDELNQVRSAKKLLGIASKE